MTLEKRLIREGRTRWLDVGSGGRFASDFHYLDVFPEGVIPEEHRPRYHRVDIMNPSETQLAKLGTFDLVRLQHMIEHFGFEDGAHVLLNCARLLKCGGALLLTAPDLRIYTRAYLDGNFDKLEGFQEWAWGRIPKDAPPSAYFSIYSHSMTYESHRWCYDYEGLVYQLRSLGKFKNIRRLLVEDEEASVPFTHNRPAEDVCVLAEKS